ncbi:PREDICTED: FK506-binding protein 15-like [Acropora digitifera]|uniref:FK506-binding protein 15-like n=1 Tax=Acropora digitifera TaxID=70779 RepID=UPI000779FFD8|nr:PREDICTED: FK506-binding protein 15-like [Acropora digitifera]
MLEGSYEDFEIVGDTVIRQTSDDTGFEVTNSHTDLNLEESVPPTFQVVRYYRPTKRVPQRKNPEKSDGSQDGDILVNARDNNPLYLSNSSSKLASLFGQDRASFSGGNESLTYTPPKQPKKEKAVHKISVNGQYANQGKLGAAVLANHSANDYKILVYASKQQQVTAAKINGNFTFTGVSGRVPANSSLLFEVDVLRIKSNRESTESPVTIQEAVIPQNSDQLPDILSEPSGTKKRPTDSGSQPSVPGESGIKGRTASLTEQLSQSLEKGTDKARLLARMSKMGKSPLSLPGAVTAEPENDDLVEADQEVPPSPEQASVPHTVPRSSTESPVTMNSNPHPSPRSKPQPPPRPVHVHPEVQQTLHNPTPSVQPVMNPQPMMNQPHVMNPQPAMPSAFSPQQQVALYQPPTSNVNYPPMLAPQPQIMTAPPYFAPPPAPPAPAPAQPSANDAMVPVLMAETRQQQGEIRMSIAKMSDKIDEISNKIDRQHQSSFQLANQMSPANQMSVGAYGNPQAVMEASLLVHNINRIVQENEKLKDESTEKTKKIETLNDKISDLLQKNQRFVEDSNTMLEQRSDSLQVNTAQSQARVMSLEQEKIAMSGDLISAKTQMVALQNEVTSLRQREAEVSSQLNKVSSEAEKLKNELDRTKDSHSESNEQSERLKQSLKEERQTRKKFESKVEHIEEELNDVRNEKESLEKVLGERKKKYAADKKKFEEELEELRSLQEEEIRFLKEKHKKEKHSSGTATAQQIALAEAEQEERWTEKAGKMVAQTEEKWKRKLQEVTEEKEEASKKASEIQEKYFALKKSGDTKEEAIKDLQDKLEDLEGIQEKYNKLKASQGNQKSVMDELQSTEQELESLRAKV